MRNPPRREAPAGEAVTRREAALIGALVNLARLTQDLIELADNSQRRQAALERRIVRLERAVLEVAQAARRATVRGRSAGAKRQTTHK